MPGFDRQFPRTPPAADEASLLTSLRGLDATAGIFVTPDGTTVTVKKNSAWTGPQITQAQNAIDTAPAATPQRSAQTEIDNVPIATRSLMLMLLDEINVLRAELNTLRAKVSPPLTPPLPDRTEQQAKTAWRAKAGTL